MQFSVSVYPLLALLAVAATALPSSSSPLQDRQVSTDPSINPRKLPSLFYPFTLSSFLAADPKERLPFGFPNETLNTRGLLGVTTIFRFTEGKLVLERNGDLEVGSDALRQPVVLLPKRRGVPVRVSMEVIDGKFETILDIDRGCKCD